jgi:hypothetical protein
MNVKFDMEGQLGGRILFLVWISNINRLDISCKCTIPLEIQLSSLNGLNAL